MAVTVRSTDGSVGERPAYPGRQGSTGFTGSHTGRSLCSPPPGPGPGVDSVVPLSVPPPPPVESVSRNDVVAVAVAPVLGLRATPVYVPFSLPACVGGNACEPLPLPSVVIV